MTIIRKLQELLDNHLKIAFSTSLWKNSSGISSIPRELNNLLESQPAAPLSLNSPEDDLRIDLEISPPFLILGDLESGYI